MKYEIIESIRSMLEKRNKNLSDNQQRALDDLLLADFYEVSNLQLDTEKNNQQSNTNNDEEIIYLKNKRGKSVLVILNSSYIKIKNNDENFFVQYNFSDERSDSNKKYFYLSKLIFSNSDGVFAFGGMRHLNGIFGQGNLKIYKNSSDSSTEWFIEIEFSHERMWVDYGWRYENRYNSSLKINSWDYMPQDAQRISLAKLHRVAIKTLNDYETQKAKKKKEEERFIRKWWGGL